ncbi:MAG: hypothetical protein QM489_00885 [Candidatus Izemoplasma sp.]
MKTLNLATQETIVSTINVEINPSDLSYSVGSNKDIDSNNITLFYQKDEIGSGHLNNRTNWAHISLDVENPDLEDYFVEGIEGRTIKQS